MSDDRELVERLQAGDLKAFELLVRLHHRAVYNVVYQLMGDHAATDDVVQDAFMKALRAIDSFRGDSSFKSWVVRIALNTGKNALRSSGRAQMVEIDEREHKVGAEALRGMEQLETSDLLRKAIENLPPKQRMALELRIFESLSFKEIADAMECPFDTAKANFRHAILNLKKMFEDNVHGMNIEELKLAFASMGEHDHDV
ncbi:MAG TPA: sigma-70 family RNA polymerase sigma factor [Bdellovibrionota bacterium]|nr:sigma-70 family RNA polymerase sigma factor [Bdellovibrionota bacterium]